LFTLQPSITPLNLPEAVSWLSPKYQRDFKRFGANLPRTGRVRSAYPSHYSAGLIHNFPPCGSEISPICPAKFQSTQKKDFLYVIAAQ
jgi:hypothetical protein